MGVLNVTPNSYFQPGKYLDSSNAIAQGIEIASQGADIIDVGGYATNPFSTFPPPTIEEEIKRIQPVIKALKKEITTPISIDTFNPEVAQVALDEGANFLNDIYGFRNKKMRELAKAYRVPICIMHMQKTPQDMQTAPSYPEGVVQEIMRFLKKQAELCAQEGIDKNQIYLDPGIGFGKSLDDNFEILHNLDKFRALNSPLLIGLSRKSFIYKTLKVKPQESLSATIAVSTYVYPYVDMLRVHDVKEHKEMIQLLDKLISSRQKIKEIDRDSTHIHSDH